MPCELCGGGDRWIKTCLAPGGSRLLVCDPCWEEHAAELVIVPGDHVVVARCGGCGTYGNPRNFSEVRLGGRKGAYSGTCPACAREVRALRRSEGELRLPPGYRLDRTDPDVWALRRAGGWVVARFSAQGATSEAVERGAWEDHESVGEEEYP